jgi:DNA-binding response OmpR family regulator
MSERILLVEDQVDLAFGIQRNLEFDGYQVEVVHDGQAALDQGLKGEHDLMILDLMLPELDGMSVLARLRSEGITTPVLILSARTSERDKVSGLRSGADDYLAKPFGLGELLARVEALLRRARPTEPDEGSLLADTPFQFGSVEVDVRTRSVRRDQSVISVAPREFDLLVALCRAGGAARARHELLREVWGHKADIETRTVDTHIAELRKKLEEDPSHPRHILTVRTFGYRLDLDPA